MGALTTDQPDGSVFELDTLNLPNPLRILVAAAAGGNGGVLAYMRLNVADDSVVYPSAATINTMLGLTEPVGAFALQADAAFTLGANGAVTYVGPDLEVLLTCNASLFTNGMVGFIHLGIARNDDLIGEAATNNNIDLVTSGCSMAGTAAGDAAVVCVARRRLTLQSGDTIRPVSGTQNGAGASDVTVLYLQLTIEQVAA